MAMSFNGITLTTSVKNTFIDVPVPSDSPQLRRSNSVPAGLRLMHYPKHDIKAVDPFMLQRGESWADASTDDSEEEGLSPSDSGQSFDTDTDNGSTCGIACMTVESSPRNPQVQPLTPLSSKATPWQPQAFRRQPQAFQMVVRDPLPNTFVQEAARLVTLVQNAVDKSELAQEVKVVNEASGWFISVKVKNLDKSVSEKIQVIAKEALLKSATISSCTYVMGYACQPFKDLPEDGFSATLGAMADESQACWDIYENGICHNCGCCRYQHPRCTRQLSVGLCRI